ncbi:MAG: thioredoxin family protein [Betaproteobacteria bacterium]
MRSPFLSPPEGPRGAMSAGALLAVMAALVASVDMDPTGVVVSRAIAAPAPDASASQAAEGIAWREGDVDGAFAAARAANKPVFLYWGAVWCPPCNQVKATIFNRQDFIDRSRFFVPVYLDGDSKSAQKLGERFKVVGYPTMILFTPDGREITRLPGEVDADQYMRVLAMGMGGARPVKDTLAAALAPGGKLSAEEWRMLAYYPWYVDEQQVVPKAKLNSTLAQLAGACPADQRETAARLRLKALTAAAAERNVKPRDDRNAVAALSTLLANPRVARDNIDLIVYYSDNAVRAYTLPRSPERAKLVSTLSATLQRQVADTTLSSADRLAALDAQISLAKVDDPKATLDPALLKSVREQVARVDRETTDPYARQAVISSAAEVLADAGLLDESDALLKAELQRSQSPYYYMLGLAANAKTRGDKAGALDWYQKAYAAADGPATRLQWGASYVRALVELSPQDSVRIDAAVNNVLSELEAAPETFYGRNQRALEKISGSLIAWDKQANALARRDGSLTRFRAQLADVCAKLPAGDPSRASCQRVQRGTYNAKA